MAQTSRPPHPCVDWSTLRYCKPRSRVIVTCPHCKEKREEDAGHTTYRIKNGTFTGFCYQDRLVNKVRRDRQERPTHSQVDWNDTIIVQTTRCRVTKVAVTCPICESKRYCLRGQVASNLRQGTFHGRCKECIHDLRTYPPKPYLRVARKEVEPEDLWLFDAMRLKQHKVLAHRLVMARKLGRPLLTNELVDHQDGNHVNNDPDNLRLYLRGQNQPGSGPGYGTFYSEWQRAEARIRELTALLTEHGIATPPP